MIFLLWIINCISLYYMMDRLNHEYKQIIGKWLCVCTLQFLFIFITQWDQLLLVLFYLALYISKLAIFQIMKENRSLKFMVINVSFIFIISCHLIIIALFAIYHQVDMSTVIQMPQFSLSCFMVFLVVDTCVNFIVGQKRKWITNIFHNTIYEQYRSFEYFLWFCDVFLLTQSILCQQDHFRFYIALFLICNDVLLLILVVCFIRNIYHINEQSYVEKENEQLQNESNMRRKNMEDMKKYADYDILTKAHSRKYTMQYMQTLILRKTAFSIAFIDLDELKQINDVHGHSAGDQYLRSFAESIEIFLHEGDILGRIGGDEFILIMIHMNQEQASSKMASIYDSIQHTTTYQAIRFSYGICAYDATKHDVTSLIKEADESMYQQKMEHRKGKAI